MADFQYWPKIKILLADITKLRVDVIVNAANPSLLGGGGVDGAIHRAGGPAILEECLRIARAQGPSPPGKVVLTNAGALNAKVVAHAVGPIWHGGNNGEPEQLKNCYLHALELSQAGGFASVAFPAISTGVYSYPKEPAAKVVRFAIEEFFSRPRSITAIVFALYDQDNLDLYKKCFADVPDIDY